MSRCFPFPPPGYEKKPRSENLDFLAKEKQKEKKHKKEKKDKEKREGKEKKDKDRSKDKHKEKKDRKEKQKNKKKDKHKDKSRSSEDRRTEERTESHHEDRFGECSQKAEEVKDFKFTEDLGRRIKDEEKRAANRMVENFACSFQRTTEKSSTATLVENKRVTGNEMLPNHTGTMQRRNDGMEHPADNFPGPIQRRIECIGSGNAMQKERSASSGVVLNSISSGQRGNTAMGLSAENSKHSIQRRSEGLCITTASEKERGTGDKIVSKASVTVQRAHDGMDRPAESPSSFSGAVHRKIDGVGIATAMEKERGNGNPVVPIPTFTEQRRNDVLGKSAAKNPDKNIEEKEKTKEREVDDGKGQKRKDRDEKNRGKDKNRHKEKKEKIREKDEHKHKEQHKPRDSGKKDPIDSLNIKQLAPEKGNGMSAGSDGTAKKRKDFEMNGFLNDKDVHPNKLSRAAPTSDLPVENGRTQELSHVSTPYSSIKPGVISNKAERVLEIKDQKINGSAEAKPSSADLEHSISVDTREKAESPLKRPHRDAKHLNQIYSVPKMEEWPESDDQEWLFGTDHLRPKPKTKIEVVETPHVWAKALQIESEDVIALPYVIPF